MGKLIEDLIQIDWTMKGLKLSSRKQINNWPEYLSSKRGLI